MAALFAHSSQSIFKGMLGTLNHIITGQPYKTVICIIMSLYKCVTCVMTSCCYTWFNFPLPLQFAMIQTLAKHPLEDLHITAEYN